MRWLFVWAISFLLTVSAMAQSPFGKVAQDVNRKLVKLYGSGGYRGLPAYGTGILVSSRGHILTVANHILDTQDLRVHVYDGRRFRAKVVVIEPEFDAALLKIDTGTPEGDKELDLEFFDIAKAAQSPLAQSGDWVLAFSNQFQIATRDEPMTVQRGTIASYTRLHGRRGIFEASFTREVYVTDAIMCNPGAAGGALTTRKGELLGIVGKELRNTLSETWINYAVPVQSKAEFTEDGKSVVRSLADFVDLGMQEKWKPTVREKPKDGPGGYHGIVLVPNVVERTPPFVDGVRPDSPAQKAGLQPDDLIVYVDGEPIGSIKQFIDFIAKTHPGLTIKLEVRRGDKLMTVDLKLDEIPKRK
jgi:serine protease Do